MYGNSLIFYFRPKDPQSCWEVGELKRGVFLFIGDKMGVSIKGVLMNNYKTDDD